MRTKPILPLFVIILLSFLSSIGLSQTVERWEDWCQQGAHKVLSAGITSSTTVQQSFPRCTITVYDQGTTNLATIYNDRGLTPKANPFQADSNGYVFFYAACADRYDIRFSGGTSPNTIPTPFTRADIMIPCGNGGSTPFNLTVKDIDGVPTVANVDTIRFTNGTVADDGGGQVTVTIASGGCTPTGSSGQVIYNNSGACAGIVNATTPDGTTLRVTSGDFITDLRDTNHAPWIGVIPTASAVTYINVTNNSTGLGPFVTAVGETNTDLNLDASGTGEIRFHQASYSIPVTLTYAAFVDTNVSLSNRFTLTLTGDAVLNNPLNGQDNQQVIWTIIQDGSGGHALSFDTQFTYGTEISACNISLTINKRSFVTAIYNQSVPSWNIVGCVTGY